MIDFNMQILIIFLILVWFGMGIVGMIIGIHKDASGCATIASIPLGPIGLLSSLLFDSPVCPYCKEIIKKDATICKHCGEHLNNKKNNTSK